MCFAESYLCESLIAELVYCKQFDENMCRLGLLVRPIQTRIQVTAVHLMTARSKVLALAAA